MSEFLELPRWGFDSSSFRPSQAHAVPARVVRVDRGRVQVITESGPGVVLGPSAEVAVGDYVELRATDAPGTYRLLQRLPRRNILGRKAPGRSSAGQTLVANVDRMGVVTAFGGDLSVRRIERYLSMAREAEVPALVIVNKRDRGAPESLAALEAILGETPLVVISAAFDPSLSELETFLVPGATLALLGSSGVGKSTLINRWLEAPRLAAGSVRARDETGRHTTTRRELLRLPNGALVIDTPGLREVGLGVASDSVEGVFEELATLAAVCRFSDCQHRGEPGCAVASAIEAGQISKERLEAYHRLIREVEGEARRRDEHARRSHERALHRMYEAHQSHKRGRRSR